jgi:hypothetical protein
MRLTTHSQIQHKESGASYLPNDVKCIRFRYAKRCMWSFQTIAVFRLCVVLKDEEIEG